MPLVVTWSRRVSAGALAFSLLMVPLGWWCLVDARTSAQLYASLCAAMGGLALLFFVETLRFRVAVDANGFSVRSLRGDRRVAWGDILAVRFIAQRSITHGIESWDTEDAAAAFHVVLDTARGRVRLNRWMSGLDEFCRTLARAQAIDAAPAATLGPTTSLERRVDQVLQPVNRVLMAAMTVKVAFAALFMLALVSLVSAASGIVAPTRHLFTDMAINAAAATLGFYLAYHIAHGARRRRFGDLPPSTPFGPSDALFAFAGVLGGGLLLFWFVPRLLRSAELVDGGLSALGLFLLGSSVWIVWRYSTRA